MAIATVEITRYPNRRFYDHNASSYVSLEQIEELVRAGNTVQIRGSQTGEDLTRVVLARIIIERQPDKMQLFPVDMLHFMVRANSVMADFLRDYFQHSLPYLEYLQRHSAAAVSTLIKPMHWIKAWLDSIVPQGPTAAKNTAEMFKSDDAEALSLRVAQLEERLRQMEMESGEKEPANTESRPA
jgi:polyhydroxyalkanoate synthesis repressor PhaR